MEKFVLGKKLRRLRVKNCLTVSTLSELLMSHNILATERTIYRWEQDISIPDLNTLKILSIIYNVNLPSIFDNQNSNRLSLTKDEIKFIKMFRDNKTFYNIVLLLTK